MAETLTDKLKLSKRDTGDINWGQGANANLDAVDQHVQQATLRPPRTLLASLGSGAVGANLLGSTTYFYKVTAVNAAGETTEGKIPAVVEAQVTESASPVPVILSWETVKGATSYKIYKSTASGQEKFLASVSGEATAVYTDDGNTAVNGAISVPAANTARTSISKIVAGTNVTVTPPDGTGEVTINAASAAPPDASTTVKGVSKLSIVPAVAANPIAVGDNDSRNTNARTPTGAAGGDLGGTYPNPTVAKVNGTSVPASPSAGQVLTATGPTAATWQTPATGGSGYATVVVAAPTGVSATDTANIQAALNAITAAGGSVVLREGTYLLNAALTIQSKTTLVGQGLDVTILDSGALEKHLIGGLKTDVIIRDLTLKGPATQLTTFTYVDDTAGELQRWRFQKIKFSGIRVLLARQSFGWTDMQFLSCVFDSPTFSSAFGQLANISNRRWVFTSCFFNGKYDLNGGNGTQGQGGEHIIQGCVFEGNIELLSINSFFTMVDGNIFRGAVSAGNKIVWLVRGHNVLTNNEIIDTNTGTLGGDSIFLQGVSNNCVVAGNKCDSIQLGSGTTNQVVVANRATVVDNSTSTTNVVAQNFVTGLRKLGEASPLTGDVKLEAGSGITLTQDAPNNKITVASAGGSGYAKVVVAAPTGVAATDTANIQAALTAAASAPGGTAILREGTYVVNNTLTLVSRLTLQGQGMNVTKIQADASMGNVAIIAGSNSSDAAVRDLQIDGNQFNRGTKTVADIRFDQNCFNTVLERMRLSNPAGNDSVYSASIVIWSGGKIISCDFFIAGAATPNFIAGNSLEVRNSTFSLAVAGTYTVIDIPSNGVITGNTFTLQQTLILAALLFGSGSEGGMAIVKGNRFNASVTNTTAIKFDQGTAARATIYGNVAQTTAPGNITVSGAQAAIVGNVGFASYAGGSQMVGNV